MRDKIFYSIISGFLLGTLARSFIFMDIYAILFLCVLALASFRKLMVLVFLFAVALGVLRFHVSDHPVPLLEGEIFEGVVIDEPDVREENQKLTVKTEKTKILVTTGLERYFHYGDGIRLEGKAERPENFVTDQGKDFDYVSYLRKDGITHVMIFPKIEIVSQGGGNPLKRFLFSLKEKFLGKMNAVIPAPESILSGGLILGERSAFPEDMRQKFVDTGTIHIVALSGYNVTIVAEWIMKLCYFLPRSIAFCSGIAGIVLFVIMAGGQSTAVRAGIMAVFALVARATGRGYDVGRGMAFAAAGMVMINPFVLAFDVSFQLSFMATFAVIFIAPKLKKYVKYDLLSTTLAAYLFISPYIFLRMGTFSWMAIPANLLILPVIPLAMLLSFLSGILPPFGFFAYLPLHYILRVIDLLRF